MFFLRAIAFSLLSANALGYIAPCYDSDQNNYRPCYRPSQRSNITKIQVKREFIVNAPDRLDYREQNLVTEVKEQGRCEQSSIYAAIGNIEGMNAKKTGNLISLSEPQAMDCSKKGGAAVDVMNDLVSQGCESKQDYPKVQGSCRTDPSKVKVRVSEGHTIDTPDAATLKGALVQNGAPLAIELYFPNSAIQAVGRKILNPDDCNGQPVNHGALLVGYDTDSKTGRPYWIMKNSWGTSVGDNGYFYFDFENLCSFGTKYTATCTIA